MHVIDMVPSHILTQRTVGIFVGEKKVNSDINLRRVIFRVTRYRSTTNKDLWQMHACMRGFYYFSFQVSALPAQRVYKNVPEHFYCR